MKKLVIVESPSKSKTIEKYLGDDFKVVASMGHIRDLATTGKFGLGVDVEGDFEPSYIPMKGKKKVISDLKKLAKDFNYDDVNQFIIDNFGLFLITCPNFVGHVKFSDIKDLVKSLEEPMNNSEVSPSKYWSGDKELKAIMERWNPGDVALIPTEQYDTTDTQKILEEIVFVNGNNN